MDASITYHYATQNVLGRDLLHVATPEFVHREAFEYGASDGLDRHVPGLAASDQQNDQRRDVNDAHSMIFQNESLRVIFPPANSSRSTPRTSSFFPETVVPVSVHSDTPKSSPTQWRSSP